jgi:hypothetical protein
MKQATHLTQMLYVAAGLFAVLVLTGVPLGTALTYGVLLACPLMMVWMLILMGGQGHGHEHHHREADAAARPPHATDRLSDGRAAHH